MLLDLVPAGPFAVATYPPGATYGPRRLLNYEFVWILSGDTIYTTNGASVSAPEGSLVLCRPCASDGFAWDKTRQTRHAYFHFQLQGDPPAEWPDESVWPIVRAQGDIGDLSRALFSHLLAWNGRGDGSLTRLLALSLLAAHVTGQTQSQPPPAEPLPEAVASVLNHIARRLDADSSTRITLSELANVACVSAEHLCRLFRAATGHAPAETVRLARLARAVSLLARTNYSVGEIAQITGFDNPFHFTRRFTQVYGRSPRALRQAILSGEPVPNTPLHRKTA